MLLALIAAVSATVACGPELTEPAASSVTGKWASADTVSSVSLIALDLVQAADGKVTGTWKGRAAPGSNSCPAAGPACPVSNVVTGSHTVLELRLDILGAGKFTGQLVGSALKGDLLRDEGDFRIQFSRVP